VDFVKCGGGGCVGAGTSRVEGEEEVIAIDGI